MSDRDGVNPPEGCLVYIGTSRELLLDLDAPHSMQTFVQVLPIIEKYLHIERIRIWPSRHNVHAAITLGTDLDDMDRERGHDAFRFLLQACLGSDPLREFLNYADCRYRNSSPSQVNVLFRPCPPENLPFPSLTSVLPDGQVAVRLTQRGNL